MTATDAMARIACNLRHTFSFLATPTVCHENFQSAFELDSLVAWEKEKSFPFIFLHLYIFF